MTITNPYIDKLRALKKRETCHPSKLPELTERPSGAVPATDTIFDVGFVSFVSDRRRSFFEKALASRARTRVPRPRRSG